VPAKKGITFLACAEKESCILLFNESLLRKILLNSILAENREESKGKMSQKQPL